VSPRSALDRVLVDVHERFTVPSVLSAHGGAWQGAHDLLALPLGLRGPVERWRGDVDGTPVAVTCVGRPKRFRRMLRQWFGAPALVTRAPRPSVLHDPAALEALGGDLLLAAVHPWAAARFRRAGWTIVPEAVRWTAPLEAVPPAEPAESLRSDLRKLARQGWTHDEGAAARDWDEFFETMVFPAARARFGAEVWIPGRHLRARFRRTGRLHFICRDGERVAGFVLLTRGDRVWSPVLGVVQDRPELHRDGIATAIYDGIVRRARLTGRAVLDVGRTAPFLTDGVQRVKRKWGFRPSRDRLAQLVAVRPAPGCGALAEALAREPLLAQDGQGMLAPWPGPRPSRRAGEPRAVAPGLAP
jgi:hypothetical protein